MPRLTDATLDRSGGLVLTYTVDEDLPDSGHWLLSTTVIDGENGPIHQYGVKVVDGAISSVFDFDHAGSVGQRSFTTVTPRRVGTRWTVTFPVDHEAVPGGAKWRANLEVNGTDQGEIEGIVED